MKDSVGGNDPGRAPEALEDPPIVAIDGPSGVGKSTAARGLAERLGIPYVDTGAMYRAIAWACLKAGADLDDADSVAAVLASSGLQVACRHGEFIVCLADRVLGEEIRTAEVSVATSRVSVHAVVRNHLVELQRQFGSQHGGVFEGRDIGTVVFPAARHKFFMEASPEVRARRRHDELSQRGDEVKLEELERQMEERDARDRSRPLSPLRADSSYERIDTATMTRQEVVERLARQVEARRR